MFRLGRLDGVVTKGLEEGDESNEDGQGSVQSTVLQRTKLRVKKEVGYDHRVESVGKLRTLAASYPRAAAN